MILDTNALSAFADGLAAIAPHVQSNQVALPVIVLGEYRYGLKHSNRRNRYETWLEDFVALAKILEITEETTLWYAQIRSDLRKQGKPIPANDAWIAALSLQHRLPVLSKDRHFDHVKGLRRVAW